MAEPEGPLEPSLVIKRFDPLYWKHAIWKVFSGTAIVFLSGLIAMGQDAKTTSILGLSISTVKALDMLFDQTMARLAAGKLPVQLPGQNGHDTAIIKKPDSP